MHVCRKTDHFMEQMPKRFQICGFRSKEMQNANHFKLPISFHTIVNSGCMPQKKFIPKISFPFLHGKTSSLWTSIETTTSQRGYGSGSRYIFFLEVRIQFVFPVESGFIFNTRIWMQNPRIFCSHNSSRNLI